MAHITDLGPHAYFQRLWWQTEHPPLVHFDVTNEIEAPYRHGKCVVLRVPFRKTALVFGVWTKKQREQDALLSAIGGRVTKDNGIMVDGDW